MSDSQKYAAQQQLQLTASNHTAPTISTAPIAASLRTLLWFILIGCFGCLLVVVLSIVTLLRVLANPDLTITIERPTSWDGGHLILSLIPILALAVVCWYAASPFVCAAARDLTDGLRWGRYGAGPKPKDGVQSLSVIRSDESLYTAQTGIPTSPPPEPVVHPPGCVDLPPV
jgi:hypothetical protein